MKPNEHQRPEGELLASALKIKGISARTAATQAGMSDARWRQIVNGYASAGAGQTIEVVGPDETIARMARVVGVTPEQLRAAGRGTAADLLLVVAGSEAEKDWQQVGTALERLRNISAELTSVIEVLSESQVSEASTPGTSPGIEMIQPDQRRGASP